MALKDALTLLLSNITALEESGEAAKIAQAQVRAAEAQLHTIDAKIAKANAELEKVQKENASKAEQYKSDRARLQKTLDERIAIAKEQLDQLNSEVEAKRSQHSAIDQGLAALRARIG